jgi:glutamate/aspartate transport system substrate-binding protein
LGVNAREPGGVREVLRALFDAALAAADPARAIAAHLPGPVAGRTVVVGAGTTNAEVMRRLAGRVSPPLAVVVAPGLDAAYAMLVAGKADAFASDDILLYGFIATRPDGRRFGVVGDYLSFEPYAITLRRDDPAFADLVKSSFARMAGEGTLSRLYARWLVDRLPTGETLNLPMSPQLAEMYRTLGQPD